MSRILVSGLINIETTVQIERFPLAYAPVHYPFFGVNDSVSGVGYNVARALTTLGHDVSFLSLVGRDVAAQQVRAALAADGLADRFVLSAIDRTAQSAILYDRDGKRQIHVDLKDIQEQTYPEDLFEQALAGCDLAALCNINFSRPFLRRAKQAGRPVATDVHAIRSLDDDYNRDFMAAADILFMSDDALPMSPEGWARRMWDRYAPEVMVIGLGAQGALLCVKRGHILERVPAVMTRPVVNTIGADALFSAFLHAYAQSGDPYQAIRKAVVFASYKIGATSAADGFLTAPELDRLCAEVGA